MAQVFADPQVRHRGIQMTLPHSAGVQSPALANPMRFSDTPVHYTTAAPLLGEHTEEVLAGRLRMSTQHLAELKAKGVI
jgi:crotonobetainyl-CoA:carnitine CoA-transferase CaiB-like acyl-CoA transferase